MKSTRPGPQASQETKRETKRASPTIRPLESPAGRSRKPSIRPWPMPKLHDEDGTGATTTTTNTRTNTEISGPVRPPHRDILTVTAGPDEGHVYGLKLGETWLGRSDECDIVLVARGISRRHAAIVVTPSRVVLRENRAKNGTFVNEQRLAGERELKPGDEIQLGHAATLLYSRSRGLDAAGRKKAQDIASMVAGVAHQLNTPLGVAHTASALVESLANELRLNPTGENVAELLDDLRASAGFLNKNIQRTHELVKSFKQLSANELMGDYREDDLASIVKECVDAARPTAEQRGIRLATHGLTPSPWVGFPVAMCKVLEHLLQNTFRYAYQGREGGVVDIRLKSGKTRYRLEVEDYGVGIAKSISGRLFEPFVTANQATRADGLGLAVVHMIVTTLFGGTITCNSVEGKGTKFVIMIPFVASEAG